MIRTRTPMIDKSGSIAAGGTAQDVYATEEAPKHYLLFQNTSDEDMRIAFGAGATDTSGFVVAAGLAWESPDGWLPTGRLSVYGATTGKTFSCMIG